MRTALLLATLVLSTACAEVPEPPASAPTSQGSAAAAASQATAATEATPAAAPLGHAAIGQPAPDFTLPDLDGHPVHLAEFKGKTVVLEWFNPGCPFVKASHTKGSLVRTPKHYIDEGVVWLAVNSAGPGKEGYGAAATSAAKQQYGMTYSVLLDESGDVGHAYGATNTPHMFVIDKAGVLAYRGAIDNSPDGEGESPAGGKLVNYVDATLGDLSAGRPVAVSSTEAYGCGVKYAHP